MGLRDSFGVGHGRENIRRLALDVTVHAVELTGRRVPADWEELSAHELLRIARTSLTSAEERIRASDRRIAALQEELARARRDEDLPADRPGPDLPETPPPIVSDLIEVADRLGTLDPGHDDAGTALVTWLRSRTTAMLSRCEVAVVRDEGPVDPARHEVVDVRPASDDGQAEHIAETVRPGYAWQGRILRPQQVIAFVTKRGR